MFFWVLMKDSFFLFDLLEFSASSGFILCIIPLVAFFLFMSLFSGSLSFKIILLSACFTISLFFSGLTFLVTDPFHFLVMLESTVIPMAIAILVYSKDSDKVSSVSFMLFINLLGSVPFMYFGSQSSLFFYLFYDQCSLFLLSCFTLVLLCKLPVFLTHFWLTKAHVSAPALISMLLASIMLKLASFGLLKFSMFFFYNFYSFLSFFFSLVFFGTFLFLLFMNRFFDSKFLIACSSVVHMGLIWPCLMSGFYTGFVPSMFMMTGHGLISYLLFYLVSLAYEASQSRSIVHNKSLESSSKTLSMLFFFLMFLNMGLPPFISFLSELIFCSFAYMFSTTFLVMMGACMFLPIFFLMIFLTKKLFGKKWSFSLFSVSASSIAYSGVFLFFFCLLPFML